MSPRFEVVEAKVWHCGQMLRRLRREHMWAIACLGVDSHRELRQRFDESSFRRAWLVDGKLAGIGGVTGSPLATEGMVWLALSHDAMRYPLEMVRESRRQLDGLMRSRRRLLTTILAGDEAAKRVAVFVGFVAADERPEPRAVSRYGRRALIETVASKDDIRVPMGSGFAVVMQYDREAA